LGGTPGGKERKNLNGIIKKKEKIEGEDKKGRKVATIVKQQNKDYKRPPHRGGFWGEEKNTAKRRGG